MSKTIKYHDCKLGLPKLNLAKKTAHSGIPSVTKDQHSRLSRLNGYAAYRMVDYLINNQGARTDAISRDVAIRNPPDVVMKARPQLNRLGLDITCEMMATQNRYGKATVIGTWWLRVVDHAAWFGTVAANDPER